VNENQQLEIERMLHNISPDIESTTSPEEITSTHLKMMVGLVDGKWARMKVLNFTHLESGYLEVLCIDSGHIRLVAREHLRLLEDVPAPLAKVLMKRMSFVSKFILADVALKDQSWTDSTIVNNQLFATELIFSTNFFTATKSYADALEEERRLLSKPDYLLPRGPAAAITVTPHRHLPVTSRSANFRKQSNISGPKLGHIVSTSKNFFVVMLATDEIPLTKIEHDLNKGNRKQFIRLLVIHFNSNFSFL